MASLPLLIYTELVNPEAAGALRVWGAALTLILIIAALYLGAALVNRYLTRNESLGASWPSGLDLKDLNIYYGSFHAVANVGLVSARRAASRPLSDRPAAASRPCCGP